MTEQLKSYLLKKPFVPFRILLKDGRSIDVVRQFQVAIGKTRFAYADAQTHRMSELGLEEIVAVDPIGTENDANTDMPDPAIVDDLKRRLVQKPFRPFRIRLNTGEVLDIAEQYKVGIGLTRFVFAQPGSRSPARFKLNQIVSMESASNAAAA
jgi:hypothetical protein